MISFRPSLPHNWEGKILSGSDAWYYEGPLGTIVLQRFRDHEFCISYAVCHFSSKVKLTRKEEDVVRLQYVLEGRLSYKNEHNKSIKLRTGQMNAIWSPGRETTGSFNKGRFEILLLSIPTEMIQELLPQFPETKNFPPEHLKKWFYKETSDDFYQILDMTYGGDARLFFYKTKARENLLSFIQPLKEGGEKYSEDVRERMHRLYSMILNDLSHHYTTEELASFARMPQAKLIEAFKDIFGVSMFDLYKETKLQKAKKYLLETDVQVKVLYEIAGYDSYTGFVDAFKNRFGISPLQFRKKYRPFD